MFSNNGTNYTCPNCPFKTTNPSSMSRHTRSQCKSSKTRPMSMLRAGLDMLRGKRKRASDDEEAGETIPEAHLASDEEEEPEPPPIPIEAPPLSGRLARAKKGQPASRYPQTVLPEGPAPLPPAISAAPALPLPGATIDSVPASEPLPPKVSRGHPNSFGLIREYHGDIPTHDPDIRVRFDELNDALDHAIETICPPYPNVSSARLGNWYFKQGNKSIADFQDLVGNVIGAADFKAEDVVRTPFAAIFQKLGKGKTDPSSRSTDRWIAKDIPIRIPFQKKPGSHPPPATFSVPGLCYRPLREVIHNVCASNQAQRFHFTPYRLIWEPGQGAPEQVIEGEFYTSKAFLDAHDEVQALPRVEGCNLPRAVVAVFIASDSTHLAQFGTASLWPAYVLFGNESKYTRGKPTSGSCHHVAYFPKLPDNIQDFIREHNNGQDGPATLLTHCRRELMHGIWNEILDDDFIDAYKNGMVVLCGDGITRRLYPRIFRYIADYPEKMLLATLRDMGGRPCPRCLVQKEDICKLGSHLDMLHRAKDVREHDDDSKRRVRRARELIYNDGNHIGGTAVEAQLKNLSLIPTENAFVKKLGPLGLDVYSLFAPDILHEWDSGWKPLLMHVLRILQANKDGSISMFNERFRAVPTFGQGTIRAFKSNVSELRNMAAWGYEDILQCVLPVVEGLVPEPHNRLIQDLLFTAAYLHGLDKMRMHTETTLSLADQATSDFGNLLRKFKVEVCSAFQTVELPKERAQRVQRERTAAEKARTTTDANAAERSNKQPRVAKGTIEKGFNLNTYKFHSLGDYPSAIRAGGTLDNTNTETSEMEHRSSKKFYARTNKINHVQQIAAQEQRARNSRKLAEKLDQVAPLDGAHSHRKAKAAERVARNAKLHHFIGAGTKRHLDVNGFSYNALSDPAQKDFGEKLREHIYARLNDLPPPPDEGLVYRPEERASVFFKYDRIYPHKELRIFFTTYDVRRDSDLIKPTSQHADIMLAANDDPTAQTTHPFWYARVLGVYHAEVRDARKPFLGWTQIEFLFVRWLGTEPGWKAGWSARRLDRVGFIPSTDPGAFGFLDPARAIRGCHLIPAFSQGTTTQLLGPSPMGRDRSVLRDELLKRGVGSPHNDWDTFYVNRFVDRDMLMRYIGGGVGHLQGAGPPIPHSVDKDNDGADSFQDPDAHLGEDETYDGLVSGVGGHDDDYDSLHDSESDVEGQDDDESGSSSESD